MASLPITPRHDLAPAEIDAIEDALHRSNVARTGFDDGEGLAFLVHRDGEMAGAVEGYTWGGICEIRHLWVHEDLRGQGLGRDLIGAAIAEAGRRGCRHVLLSTYDFQAPAFYRRLGFEVGAEIADKPWGHTEFVMRLNLAPRSE